MSTALKALLWIVGILALGYFGLMFLGLFLQAREQVEADARSYQVRYVVKCKSCSLTYSNPTSDTEQIEMSGGEWDLEFTAKADQHLYISAQNNREYGDVNVAIFVDGLIAKTSSSSGAYKIASASMRTR